MCAAAHDCSDLAPARHRTIARATRRSPGSSSIGATAHDRIRARAGHRASPPHSRDHVRPRSGPGCASPSTTSSTSCSNNSRSTPSPTSTDSAKSPSFAAPTSCPNASCTGSGSTASSLIASATGTLHFTAVPPWILVDHPPRPHQERTGRGDRRHLKVLPAPGQPLAYFRSGGNRAVSSSGATALMHVLRSGNVGSAAPSRSR